MIEGKLMGERWTVEKAWQWYTERPWVVGCNFIPSNAINQLEMWQADTFDPQTIRRELGWAASLGFNTVRVYLHDLLWEDDADGLKRRLDEYLTIASGLGISTLLVLFDDCWNDDPKSGRQPDPLPGVHNSGWARSPGSRCVSDPSTWSRLERYVKGVLSAFGKDRRILLWDLYNEPGNFGSNEKSLPLLEETFTWARAANPDQPLSAGLWFDNAALNEFQLQASDVITFHNYMDLDSLTGQIAELKSHGRPLICTEYMARTQNSLFETHLPVFKREGVGCINWGLVSGKTQTIFAWKTPSDTPEPELWFHDIFYPDGRPYKPQEVEAIRRITGAG